MKRGDQGITHFRLRLGTNGQATDCSIVESSGYEELDNATCRLMVERAKFDMSTVTAVNTGATYSNRVRWMLPITAPRVLLFGITSVKFPVQSDPSKAKCQYSDGIVRIIDSTQSCDRQIAVPVTNNKGKENKLNIFNKYIEEVEFDRNAESAYNISVILAENNYYDKSTYYLEKSSILGNPLASASLCQMYGSKLYLDFVKFNPNQALEYCILSYNQGYNTSAISVYQKIIKDYGNVLDKGTLERAKNTIVVKNQNKPIEQIVESRKIINSNWYPSRDLNKNIGGSTVAFFSVEKTGKVGTCLIAQSTYSYTLDRMVCYRLKRKALYKPALIDGVPDRTWTSETVRWIPGNQNNMNTGNIIMQILLGVLGAAI
jgi:TonB family protein